MPLTFVTRLGKMFRLSVRIVLSHLYASEFLSKYHLKISYGKVNEDVVKMEFWFCFLYNGSNFFELETSVAPIKSLKEEVVYAKLTYIVYYLSSECKTDVHKTFPW